MACDPQTLVNNARCFQCYGQGEMFDAMEVVLLCAIIDGDTSMACDPQTLLDQASCLLCTIPPGMFPAIRVSLLCQIAASGGGGGGGGGGVTCGSGAPVAAPSGACALYVNTDDGVIFSYFGGAWH